MTREDAKQVISLMSICDQMFTVEARNHKKVIEAYANGADVEWKAVTSNGSGKWCSHSNPRFNTNGYVYRVKSDIIVEVNEIKYKLVDVENAIADGYLKEIE